MTSSGGGHEFCGQLQHCVELAGVRFMDTSYAGSMRTTPHYHAKMSMCLVLQGEFTHTYDRQTVRCKPSTLLFSTANSTHSETFDRIGANCCIFEFGGAWAERLHQCSLRLDQSSHFFGGLPASIGFKILRERTRRDDASKLVIEGLLCELLAAICRDSFKTSDRLPGKAIVKAREMLHCGWRETTRLSALAQQVGVHPVYLAREFRRHYQCSPGEYLRARRIGYVCTRLRSSNASIAEIAHEAGFFDHSHLCRVFAKHMGMSPTAFRKIGASAA
jgi:AraC family transcriptional regulator